MKSVKLMSNSNLSLDRQVCHALYSASNALVRAYRPLLTPLDLTYPQYVVMMSLWQRDQVSITELGGHTRFDAGTLTPILKRLESKGLITRRQAQDDERKKIIGLTSAGLKLRDDASEVPGQIAFASSFGEQEALQLKQLCETLIRSLEE